MKYHPHGSVLFVTLSVEAGLLLLSNPLCKAIIKSCLARAQQLYPVKICHLLIEATHVHLLLVVDNPADVADFIRHFKTDSAHMLNAILGREKRTIWCSGYDSPVVLTPIRALIAIAYIYSNPAKDNLEESIDDYPGFSTWKMFRKQQHSKFWKRLRRPMFESMASDSHNLRGYTKEANRLLGESRETCEFRIEPNAWMEAFGIMDKDEQARINSRLIERIRLLEARAKDTRQRNRKSAMGKERLLRQPLDQYYLPKRSGKKMWCLSEHKRLRVQFINFLKQLTAKARLIQQKWRLGDFSEAYPLGLYPPSFPKLAEPISAW